MRSISAAMALYALCLSTLFVPATLGQKRPGNRRTPITQTSTQQLQDTDASVAGSDEGTNAVQSPSSSQIDIVGPTGSGSFGSQLTVLPNGNIVITDPLYDITTPSVVADVGAVYLYDGETLEMISQLTGSTASDQVGSAGITVLSNGNFVVKSQSWRNGAAMFAGAATWASASTGVSGTVSATNSLVGTRSGDSISTVTALTNGNYIVHSINWDNGPTAENAGSATFCNGATGTSGAVTATNSLVGTTPFANVGGQIIPLPNGNYLVYNNVWPSNSVERYGAVTWGSGTTGVVGPVSSANSLVGSTTNDNVGSGGIIVLSNGNYVVRSPNWDNGAAANAGAVTWGSGTGGVAGVVSAANSLIGSMSGDTVGNFGVTPLINGNYVVRSTSWDNGVAANAGAVTWGNGSTGTIGVVSGSNSLVGSTSGDQVGLYGLTALPNGNYVVNTYRTWDNGAAVDAGAVTWGNGTVGTVGPVSAANSLVGTVSNDWVGVGGVTVLANSNYVVSSYAWDNGAAANAGAVTWGSGSAGVSGVITNANSLTGSATGNEVGLGGVTALSNGNFVALSINWDSGATIDVGAATWGNGTTGISGSVSASNSLVGTTASDSVGVSGIAALTNGNYVVRSSRWDNGAVTNVGAVTWGSGSAGITGPVSSGNSLIGTTSNDQVGLTGLVPLTNGNYVVSSQVWDNGSAQDAGAVTFGNGVGGVSGVVSPSNSLVGTSSYDFVWYVTALPNGNYVVNTSDWDNGSTENVGAVTFASGTTGISGAVSPTNSLIGSVTNDAVGDLGLTLLSNGNYVVRSSSWDNGAVFNAGAVTYAAGNGGTTGQLAAENSIVGTTPNESLSVAQPSPLSNERLVVGRPASNTVSVFDPTYTAVASGNWSDGATWNYGAFEKPHDVVIPSGRAVTLDVDVPGPGGSLTIEGSADFIVDSDRASGSPIRNDGFFLMFNGKLDMGSNTFSSSCTAFEALSTPSSYLIGGFNKEFCSPGSYTFPIGTADGYAPVNVSVTSLNSNPSSLTIRSTGNVHPGLYSPNSLKRYWSITESGDLTADLTFNYLDGDVEGNEAGYKLFRIESAGLPESMSTAVLNAPSNSMSISGVSQFSDWAIGSLTPSAAGVTVTGRVTAGGRPVSRAYVSFSAMDGNIRYAVTNTFGHYRIDGLLAGSTYTAAVESRRYTFDARVVNLGDDVTGLDFVGR